MSDEGMRTHTDCGWVKLFHQRGVQVTIPLRGDIATFQSQVESLFHQGWLATAPGMEEGETKDMIGWVVHRFKENDNGSTTDIVDLYADHERMTFCLLTVYLNHAEDVKNFEKASGMRLTSIPVYEGAGKLERGASTQTDKKIIRASKPFAVCWKDNPKHDPNEPDKKKMKPKRLFSRWPDLPPEAVKEEAPKSAEPVASHDAVDDEIKAWAQKFVSEEAIEKAMKAVEAKNSPNKEKVFAVLRDRLVFLLIQATMNPAQVLDDILIVAQDKVWGLNATQLRDVKQHVENARKTREPAVKA